ncbi:hypothetical protein D3C76_1795590 [compost metagenome]
MDSVAQEVGSQVTYTERCQIRGLVVDGGIQTELEGWIGGFTVENIEGVAADELHRSGGEANL